MRISDWSSDVCSSDLYLAGRSFGRRKLAPKISPGKTIEGAIGGLLLCALWGGVAGSFVFDLHAPGAIAIMVALSMIAAMVSIIGDLTESMLKRIVGLKDRDRKSTRLNSSH